MRTRVILGLLAAAIAAAYLARPPDAGSTIVGTARVIDGDSLEIGATSIRLHGVDAPEGRQTCLSNAERWSCGEAATAHLRSLVGAQALECRRRDIDSYGRTVAVCTAGSLDVGEDMVLAGLALAYRQFSDAYVDEEQEAARAKRGLWAGEFTPPWEYRRSGAADESPPRAAPDARARECSDGCCIKGNINDGRKIFHVPDAPSYTATVIDERKGERWFCSADEARAAGWRAPGER